MNVSLILCTRNRRDILIHNLELFIDQFNIGDEIIIVDSSDRPRAIGREDFGEVKPNIRYFHTLPGLPLQRNYGIAKATCDLVMFLDDDIYKKIAICFWKVVFYLLFWKNVFDFGGVTYFSFRFI